MPLRPGLTLAGALLTALTLQACGGASKRDTESRDPIVSIDGNGDGEPDCLDVDGDQVCSANGADFMFPTFDRCGPQSDGCQHELELEGDRGEGQDPPSEVCIEAPLDADGDGSPEGIDLDCDGVAEIELQLPPGFEGCEPSLIDEDGDGAPDCVSLACLGIDDLCW